MKTQLIKFSTMTLIAFVMVFSGNSYAQEKTKKTETVEIKSSVVCGMCEERITKGLTFEKGVTDIKVDLESKVITVTFKTKKTDKETIKKAITKIGYDADDLLADDVAYEKLPACCKKGVDPH